MTREIELCQSILRLAIAKIRRLPAKHGSGQGIGLGT
jgi:hypothetical protein